MWSSLTKDLTEFAQTVAASSAEVLAQIAPVDLSENHNEIGIGEIGVDGLIIETSSTSVATTNISPLLSVSELLQQRQLDHNTYTTPLTEEEHSATRAFSADECTDEITKALESFPVVKQLFEKFVPLTVTFEDFWRRYFHRISQESLELAVASASSRVEESRSSVMKGIRGSLKQVVGSGLKAVVTNASKLASKLDDGFNEESDGEDGEGGWDDDDVEVELEEEVEEKKEVNKKTKEKEMKEQSTNTVAVAVTVTGTGTETVETEVKNKLTAAQLAMLYKQIETLSASEIKNSALVIEMADENNVLKESVAEWTGRANKCREDRTLVVNEKKEITEDLGQKLLAAEDRVKELEVKLSGSDDGDGDCSSQELMAAERRVEELEMKLLESEDLGQKLISEVKQLEMKLLESEDLGQKLISAENQIKELENNSQVVSAQHEEQQQQFVAAVSRVKELEMKLSETSGSSDGSLVKLEAQLETQEMLDNDSDNADGGDGGGGGGGGGWGDEDDDWGEDL
ncbi:hypothetical protein ScalyP_jg5446 [Parmales sp. scaly parma]|nr:hypothetical protein ScalyP_jg5446 [Parmales sp. scaly parma]